MQNTLRNGTIRGRVGPGSSGCVFPSRSITALGFEIKGILQSAVHRKRRVPFSPEVGQGCSVIKRGKGKRSSVAGKLHLSYGDRKRARGQAGTLG